MKTRGKTVTFQGLVVHLERMEVEVGSKGWHTFEVVHHPGGVGVLPLHPDGTVTLIRQVRPAVGETLLEVPAGRLNPSEEPLACGIRELNEETGLIARNMEPLGTVLPSPGVFDEIVYLFLATDLRQGVSRQEHDEDIQTVRISLSEALQRAADGSISDAKTAIALFRAAFLTNSHTG